MRLYDSLDKLLVEADHLDRIVGDGDLDDSSLELALSVAKRVRRESTLVVQALARERDTRYSPGGTSE